MEDTEYQPLSQGMADLINDLFEEPVFDWENNDDDEENEVLDPNDASILAFDAAFSPIVHINTETKYYSVLRKFHKFLKLEKGEKVEGTYLTDQNMSDFVNAEAKRLNYSASYKATSAALNWYLQMMAMSTIGKVNGFFPLSHLALHGWKKQYHDVGKLPKQAQGFSSEAVVTVMKTPFCEDNMILLYKTIFVVMIWNAYRVDDADNLLAINVSKKQSTNLTMRNYEFKMERTKVLSRQDAVLNQTLVTNNIMCICDQHLHETHMQRAFLRQVRNNPDTHCTTPLCPYGIITEYIQAIPDPFNTKSIPGLKFFRGLSARGNPRSLTSTNLGKNKIKLNIFKSTVQLGIQLVIPGYKLCQTPELLKMNLQPCRIILTENL